MGYTGILPIGTFNKTVLGQNGLNQNISSFSSNRHTVTVNGKTVYNNSGLNGLNGLYKAINTTSLAGIDTLGITSGLGESLFNTKKSTQNDDIASQLENLSDDQLDTVQSYLQKHIVSLIEKLTKTNPQLALKLIQMLGLDKLTGTDLSYINNPVTTQTETPATAAPQTTAVPAAEQTKAEENPKAEEKKENEKSKEQPPEKLNDQQKSELEKRLSYINTGLQNDISFLQSKIDSGTASEEDKNGLAGLKEEQKKVEENKEKDKLEESLK